MRLTVRIGGVIHRGSGIRDAVMVSYKWYVVADRIQGLSESRYVFVGRIVSRNAAIKDGIMQCYAPI